MFKKNCTFLKGWHPLVVSQNGWTKDAEGQAPNDASLEVLARPEENEIFQLIERENEN